MKAMLYMLDGDDPIAMFDEVTISEMNDNHKLSPFRIMYKSRQLNSSKVMLELYRDNKMQLKLEDGRSCAVLLQHSSIDMQGNAVGVMRVLGDFQPAV